MNVQEIREALYPLKTKVLDVASAATKPCRSFNPEECIIIFSYPRSGSTWLMELIREIPGTVNLWEPLHIRSVKPFREIGFGWRQHIPESEEWREAEERFQKLFKGDYLNFWLTSRDFPLRFCTADRMIVKFVRANALMPWLLKRFDFQLTPLLLFRHPFAVAASMMKEGSWDEEFTGYDIPDMRYNLFEPHKEFLETLETKAEGMVARWCVTNKLILDIPKEKKEWLTLYYEKLLLDPEEELQRIFDEWNMEMPDGILDKIRKPSSTTEEATFQKDIKEQLSKWRTQFSDEEIDRMQRVLNYFEIDLYSKNIFPSFMSKCEMRLFD